MTDYGYSGFPPPPHNPPPPPAPVTPEELRRIGLQLIIELQQVNRLLPGLGQGLGELNARLAALQVDPQASQVNGVLSQVKGLAEALGLGIDPPGMPPKRPGKRR